MATISGTLYIGGRAAENALHAVRFARDVGCAFNTHITISFIALGIHDDQAGQLFSRLQQSVGRWWRYQRIGKGRKIGSPMGVYAHANPAGSRHVHWVAHVPDEISEDFSTILKKRLKKLAGVDDLGDALLIQPVETPGQLAKYVLRGIEPAYAEYLHIQAANDGVVSCRRTGASRSISKAARKSATGIGRQVAARTSPIAEQF